MLSARSRGFSLVELMVVVGVLAFLLLVSGPSFADWIRGSRVRNVAESMQQGLQRARADAITSNRTVSFWLVGNDSGRLDKDCKRKATSASWIVSLDDPTGKCQATSTAGSAPRILVANDAGNGASQVSVSAQAADKTAASRVAFDPSGAVVAAPDVISAISVGQDSGSARRYEVRISPAGAVRLCDPDLSAPDVRACG